MKEKRLGFLLAAEAAACVLLGTFRVQLGFSAAKLPAFPFEQLGRGLRALSLSSSVGAALALTIYAAICLTPVLLLLCISGKRKLRAEDALLPLLSILLGVTLWRMANPARMSSALGGEGLALLTKGVIGGAVWACLLAYALLRFLRYCFSCETGKLLRCLRALMALLCVLFVWAAFGGAFRTLLDSIGSLRSGNTEPGVALGASYAFLILRFLTDALPWVLDVIAVFAAMRLLDAMETDRYAETAVLAARRLSSFCGKALAATVLTSLLYHVLQLAFLDSLHSIQSTLSVPVTSLALVLSLLLLSRMTAEARAIKQDNDLMI